MNSRETIIVVFVLVLLLLGTLPFYLASELDERFSKDSCIVVGSKKHTPCQASEPSTVALPESRVDDYYHYQFFYTSIEEALALCPFQPTIIELTGYHYIEEPSRLVYNRSTPLVIRGVDSYVVVANFYGLTIVNDDVDVRFENWMADGCGVIDYGLFFKKHTTIVCMDDRCSPISTDLDCRVGGNTAFHVMRVINYRGPNVLCQLYGQLTVERSLFRNIAFTAIDVGFTASYSIKNNVFCPCGYANSQCINTHDEPFSFFDNGNEHCF